MDVSSIADMSTSTSPAQIQDMASTLVLKSALNFEQASGEAVVQLMNSLPPSGNVLDMRV